MPTTATAPEDSQENSRRPRRSLPNRLLRLLAKLLLAAVAASIGLVVALRWLPPPTSAVMLDYRLGQLFHGEPKAPLRHQWTSWQTISPQLALAVVASEDQMFPDHWGFDLEQISDALEDRAHGKRLRGASTISQQTAKNLFLWQGRSFVRKGLEAWFTLLLEGLWPKQRILEVYLNIAEFGEGVYGVHAASTVLLGKKPSQLSRADAALLAAVLPNPKRLKAARPSFYLQERALEIEEQMRMLGGVRYLDGMR